MNKQSQDPEHMDRACPMALTDAQLRKEYSEGFISRAEADVFQILASNYLGSEERTQRAKVRLWLQERIALLFRRFEGLK